MINKLIVVLLCVFLASCSAIDHKSNQNIERMASAYLSEHAAIELSNAYSKGKHLYLKFHVFSKHSNLSRTFYGVAEKKAASSPIKFISLEQWLANIQGADPVLSMPVEFWKEFRVRLAHQITPEERNVGITLHSSEGDLFLFYQNDVLQAMDLKDKPANVSVKQTFTQDEISRITIDALDQYFKDKNQSMDHVILTTSTDGDFVNLFLYVDLNKKNAVDLTVIPNNSVYKQNVVKKGVKSADQLIVKSHLLGIVTRPFSSGYRLFSWTKGTTYDVVKPKALQILEKIPVPAISNKGAMNLLEWEDHLDRIVGKNLSKGTIDFLIDGDEFFPRMIETISQAESSIDFRIFIFDNDDFALKVADLLKKKAKEGVKVRVLLDQLGSVMGEGKLAENLPKGYKPPESMIKYLKDSDIEVRVRPSAWLKADHIKTIIIDKKICFTGGMNIGREYRYDWHDLMMEIKGPIVSETLYEFDIAWAHAGRFGDLGFLASRINKEKYSQPDIGYPIRTLFTRVNEPQIFLAQVEAIKRAKNYIYINNAYFSDNTILYELIKARRRGVDVRIILPADNNHEIMNASNIVTANTMFKNGIRVFFYPGMSHIKAAIYDGWLTTGSANFDKLSLKDNLEFNLATSHKESVEYLIENLFEKDFKRSLEMKEPLKAGLKKKIAGFIAEQL